MPVAARRIWIEDSSESFSCPEDDTVLRAMVSQGRHAIPIGCRGGGCGVCKVEVLTGEFSAGRMSRTHVSEDDQRRGIVLACKIRPQSDLRLRIVPSAGAKFGDRRCA